MILSIRKRAKLSRTEMANRLNVTPLEMYQMEMGIKKPPKEVIETCLYIKGGAHEERNQAEDKRLG